MSSPRSAPRKAGSSRVSAPLWSLTLPENLSPLFFFVITAVGLFAILGIGIRHSTRIEWMLVCTGPAYGLLFYVIRAVVTLVRAGMLVQSTPTAAVQPQPPACGAFRSAGCAVRISGSPGEQRSRRAASRPATIPTRATP